MHSYEIKWDSMASSHLHRMLWKAFVLIIFISCVVYGLILKQHFTSLKNSQPSALNQQTDFAETNWLDKEWIQIKHKFRSMLSANATKREQLCGSVPSKINAQIKIYRYPPDFNATTSELFSSDSNYIRTGSGRWRPAECRPRHRVAIIIPYKNREDNLNYLLTHMHPFLQRQELEYQIFIVEQANDELFNKGILMNAGFLEIMSLTSNVTGDVNRTFAFDCVIFHDVDLLPEDDRIMYSCPYYKPRHLSVAIDKYKYKMAYYRLIGGVLNFRARHFVMANGYSNQYWGWGAEDDDMEVRLRKIKIGFERPSIQIAHYRMLKHESRFKNPKRTLLLKQAHGRFLEDGLNSVKYNLTNFINYKLFSHILIDVGQPPQYIRDILNPSTTTTTTKVNQFSDSRQLTDTQTSGSDNISSISLL